MPTGKVKYFNTEKGYGFIAPDDGSTDMFAHRKECNAAPGSFLEVGDAVTYEFAFDAKKGKDACTSLSPWRAEQGECEQRLVECSPMMVMPGEKDDYWCPDG